jgi:hypothetical protein
VIRTLIDPVRNAVENLPAPATVSEGHKVTSHTISVENVVVLNHDLDTDRKNTLKMM